MRFRVLVAKGLLVSIPLILVPALAISAQKVTPGATCKVLNQKVVYLKKSYTCVKSGKKLVWKDMWASLTRLFYSDNNKGMRESWDDYIPPYKNLGAIFIKAYNKKMEGVQ